MKFNLSLTNKILTVTFVFTACVFLVALFIFTTTRPASAAPITDFNAGNIIDDAVFYNKDSMTAAQIQQFLNRLIPDCDINGTGPSEYGGGTRAQYAASVGWPGPPYPCLNAYHENPSTGETSYEKGGGAFAGGIPAGQIIYNAAQQYGINPQVLLVFLKKESAGPLTADRWPLKSQYKYAMGYGCPDSGGPENKALCDSNQAGFYKQVMKAAWQLNYYRQHPNDYRYHLGWNNIQYSPDTACGTKAVHIDNMATLSLYIYTPYTPNDGALSNYPGTAACGAYGNRNFYAFFKEWFGSTHGRGGFVKLDTPRWMQIKRDGARKVYVYTKESVGDSFSAGQQIRFVDKIAIDGKWYLRTEYNYNDGGTYAIPLEDIEDIPYQPITPKWITFTSNGNRSHPASRTNIGDYLVKGTSVRVVDQITVNGNTYYRTEFNYNNNQDIGIHSRFVSDFTPIALDSPRNFCANTNINKIDPLTGNILSTAEAGVFMIQKKTLINGTWYYQASSDSGTLRFMNSNNLRNTCYIPLEGPRSMRLNRDVSRTNPYTGATYDTLAKGTVISLSTKILLNSEWYFRTTLNTQDSFDAVIPASAFSEL